MAVAKENYIRVRDRSRCLERRASAEVAMDHCDGVACESEPKGSWKPFQYLRLIIIAVNRHERRISFQQFNHVEAGEVAKMKDHVRSRQGG